MSTKTPIAKDYIRRIIAEPPPYVSAKSWAVADGRTGRLYFARGESERREIASLTKIMTAYTALKLAKKYDINLECTRARASDKAGAIRGTRAMLDEGDTLYLWDLFHGMLLPSGNDAAITIAEFFGWLIKERSPPPALVDAKSDKTLLKNPSSQKLFVNEMNRNAKDLGLAETFFANPHGLNNYYNKSSASDVAKLASAAMADPQFRQVVSCKKYKCVGMDRDGEDKPFKWVNTNRLLEKGYNGVKTGVTQAAGPCIVISLQTDKLFLIFVLLNSRSMEQRWAEVKKLKKWAVARFERIEEAAGEMSVANRDKLLSKLVHV